MARLCTMCGECYLNRSLHSPADGWPLTRELEVFSLRRNDLNRPVLGRQADAALGVYYKLDVPTYEDYLKAKIPGLRERPLAALDLSHRDITPNIRELM